MKIAITGASGLIGSSLVLRLRNDGHRVIRLERPQRAAPSNPTTPNRASWDPNAGTIDHEALEGLDAVFHLAGESIAGQRWTAAKKTRIHESRVVGTQLVARALGRCQRPPATLVCASAIGYYGDQGDQLLDETSPPGSDFLAEVCRDWEAAADPAREKGIRVIHLRIGPVLARQGGALAQMLTPFRLGLGGVIGSGRQYMSWITLEDVVGAAIHALDTHQISGPLNTVAPNPATNRAFTRTLGQTLGRPTLLPVPAFAARLALGQIADALLLASTRVDAGLLVQHGYRFRFPELAPALTHLLT